MPVADRQIQLQHVRLSVNIISHFHPGTPQTAEEGRCKEPEAAAVERCHVLQLCATTRGQNGKWKTFVNTTMAAASTHKHTQWHKHLEEGCKLPISRFILWARSPFLITVSICQILWGYFRTTASHRPQLCVSAPIYHPPPQEQHKRQRHKDGVGGWETGQAVRI